MFNTCVSIGNKTTSARTTTGKMDNNQNITTAWEAYSKWVTAEQHITHGHHNLVQKPKMYVVCLETQDLGEPDCRRHLRLFHLLSDWDTDATENTTDTHSQYGNERRFQGFLFETWRPSPKQSQWAWVPAFLNSNNVDHILQIKLKGQGGDLMATSHLN